MNKVLILIVSVILVCIASIMIFRVVQTFHGDPRLKMQEDLAIELGVNIEDYPYRKSFPAGYFYTILQPGMTIPDVHEIIRGYEKVLHCGKTSEIYYYYSSEIKTAKRFQIVYDDHGKFVRLEGEEDDSRTLQTDGCESGQLIPIKQ